MIPRSRRVPKSSFRHLSTGRSFFNEMLSVRVIPLSTKEKSRIAVIVSKKVARTAVARNKLRRRVYSAFLPLLPLLKDGYLCLVYPRREGQKAPFSALTASVRGLCQSAGIL